jgi:hypothetical protein
MASAKKDGKIPTAETQTDTSPTQSAMTKYRKPITITAIIAGGALALGAAFAGGVAVAHNDRPHFGHEAMGAPRVEHSERGEHGMGGKPGHGHSQAPTDVVTPTPAR